MQIACDENEDEILYQQVSHHTVHTQPNKEYMELVAYKTT